MKNEERKKYKRKFLKNICEKKKTSYIKKYLKTRNEPKSIILLQKRKN